MAQSGFFALGTGAGHGASGRCICGSIALTACHGRRALRLHADEPQSDVSRSADRLVPSLVSWEVGHPSGSTMSGIMVNRWLELRTIRHMARKGREDGRTRGSSFRSMEYALGETVSEASQPFEDSSAAGQQGHRLCSRIVYLMGLATQERMRSHRADSLGCLPRYANIET